MRTAGAGQNLTHRAIVSCVLGLFACASQPPPAPPPPPPGGSLFNSVLTPFGSWDEAPGAGVVWRPSPDVVGMGFVPYVTQGHWAWTAEGWVFLSDHAWGWVTFHFGRWSYSSTYGWQWSPGSTWGPAWVDWRFGQGYIAWSPAQPPGFGGRQRWHVVEARHFTVRDLMPRSVPESPALTAALSSQESGLPPPKELVAAAIGRAVPEPKGREAREEAKAKNVFPPPAVPKEVAPAPSVPEEPPADNVLAEASPLPAEPLATTADDRPKKRKASAKRPKKAKHRKRH